MRNQSKRCSYIYRFSLLCLLYTVSVYCVVCIPFQFTVVSFVYRFSLFQKDFSWRGVLVTKFTNLLFDPCCNLQLLLPLLVCNYVVIFCNKYMLKRNISSSRRVLLLSPNLHISIVRPISPGSIIGTNVKATTVTCGTTKHTVWNVNKQNITEWSTL